MSESTENLTAYDLALRDVEEAVRRAEEIRRKELETVIESMKKTIAKYGITAEDLGFTGVRPKKRPVMDGDKPDRRLQVEPKYRGPKGEVWSGRGRLPNWALPHIEAGGSIDDFLIKKNEGDS